MFGIAHVEVDLICRKSPSSVIARVSGFAVVVIRPPLVRMHAPHSQITLFSEKEV